MPQLLAGDPAFEKQAIGSKKEIFFINSYSIRKFRTLILLKKRKLVCICHLQAQ
jgi:hypothetical protein